MKKHKDLVGKRFGRWLVLERVEKNKNRVYKWKCVCDCGKIGYPNTSTLNRGESESCGCKQVENTSKAKKNQQKNNSIGDICRSHFANIKTSASQRNIPIELDMQYLWELFLEQKERCVFTGLKLDFGNKDLNWQKRRYDTTASLDRKDSNKGYVKGNVQWVHKVINKAKNSMTDEEFLWLCNKVSDFKKGLIENEENSTIDDCFTNSIHDRFGGRFKSKNR